MSGEVMGFPKTVEEFMEEYKIIDSEQVYTNGAELVPIFRMEQWFEHLRHGKWKQIKAPLGSDFIFYQCSICGETRWHEENYCPHCGALMDKEMME